MKIQLIQLLIISCWLIMDESNKNYTLVVDANGKLMLQDEAEVLWPWEEHAIPTVTEPAEVALAPTPNTEDAPHISPTLTEPKEVAQQTQSEQTALPVTNNEDGQWTDNQTKLFLNLYEENKDEMGVKYKTKAKKWEHTASEMRKQGCNVTGQQCRNRFTTLERAYKRVMDHNKKTGRNRMKIVVSEDVKLILTNIFSKKDNVTLPAIIDDESDMTSRTIDLELDHEDPNENPDSPPSTPSTSFTTAQPSTSTSNCATPQSSSTPTPTPQSNTLLPPPDKRTKPTLVSELKKLREQQKDLGDRKLNKLEEYIRETKRA